MGRVSSDKFYSIWPQGGLEKIAKTRKYINPCLEKFLYDFLESIIHRDYQVIEAFDSELDAMEADILGGGAPPLPYPARNL